MLACQVDFFVETPEWAELGAPRANLVAWLERMNESNSMKSTVWPKVAEMARAA